MQKVDEEGGRFLAVDAVRKLPGLFSRIGALALVMALVQSVACGVPETANHSMESASGSAHFGGNLMEALEESPGARLPAWDEGPELGKSDQFDDWRVGHPELYGVTAPPSRTIRPLAEYEPTQAVMIRPGPDVGKFHASIIRELAGHVPAVWVMHATGQALKMEEILVGVGVPPELLQFIDVTKTDANWVRDFGPVTVLDDQRRLGFVDFRYYHQRAHDDAVPARLAQWAEVPVFRPSLSLEGGNLMADTHGACYLTQKLYTQNAGHTPAEVDQWMREYLGCTRLVIVKRPEHLSTGHIDMFAKLMGPQVVLVGQYQPGVEEVNGAILDAIALQLGGELGEEGDPLTVLRIPMPPFVEEVWYTYTNSLLVNDVLLMPTFEKFGKEDSVPSLEAQARAVYEQARPDVEIVNIPSDSIIRAGGAVHCMTMSLPQGDLVPFQEDPVLLCDRNEIDQCGSSTKACNGWPVEGECLGKTLRYCGEDGYPREIDCSECCGLALGDPWMDWHTCLTQSECQERVDCQAQETGCSELATHAWHCEVPTGQTGQRRYEECEAGPCVAGACTLDASQYCQEQGGTCLGPWAVNCGPVGSQQGTLEGSAVLCVHGAEVCQLQDLAAVCVPKDEVPSGACLVPGLRRCNQSETGVEICSADSVGALGWVEAAPCEGPLVCLDGNCLPPLPAIEPQQDVVSGPDADEEPGHEVSGGSCAAGGCASARLSASGLMLLALMGMVVNVILGRAPVRRCSSSASERD